MIGTQNTLRYRADIDGMRAVAVLAVVLFHAGVAHVGGGYVGVDIFFVISGYLITGALLHDHSIVRFYQRRARRILPALFLLLAVVLLFGALLFLPHDLSDLSKSAAATLAFSSNIFFWRKAGYFATETELWPLLHTWSLGVEEQFYIVFPLVVRLFRFLPPRRLTLLFLILAIGSFAGAVFGMSHLKPVLVFYLAPTRAWELLIGSIFATGAVPSLRGTVARTGAALIGLAAILVPVLLYTPATAFPGLGAVPPVIGAALVIWAGIGGEHQLSRLLGWRPIRFVGLISYSLYLWHWPALAFARYVAVRPLHPSEAALAILAAFLLSIISWRYVEQPFRRGFSNTSIWLGSLGGIVALLAICAVFVGTGGLPGRFPTRIERINEASGTTWRCPITELVPFGGFYACPINLPSRRPSDADVVLWGDSHAQMYAPALRLALEGRHALLINANGCAPVLGEAASADCGAIQRANYALIRALPAKTVILAQNWPQYRDEAGERLKRAPLPAERYQDALVRLRALVAGLRGAGKKVILIGPVAGPGYNVASETSRSLLFQGHPTKPTFITRAAYLSEEANILAAFAAMKRDPGVSDIRVDSIACDAARCPYIVNDEALFSDYGHYTEAFSKKLAPLFRERLQQAQK